MAKYQYAFDATNRIVDALSLPKDRSALEKTYTCISCGLHLIAKTKNDKRVKHFAHATDQQNECGPETYLHKLGKAVFRETYVACLEQKQPFTIQLFHRAKCARFSKLLGDVCQSGRIERRHDLTQLYDEIREEKRDDSFIPDLLLTKRGNPSRRLYIEIAVTHKASVQKRESGNRIIEISIGSENDLEKIQRRNLSEEDGVTFMNFGPKPIHLTDSECICVSKKWHLFRVFRSGSCYMLQLPPAKIEAMLSKEAQDIAWWGVEPFGGSGGHVFVDFVNKADSEGAPIRNCFICRYSGKNFSMNRENPVFCKFLQKTCQSTEAAKCSFFRRKTREQHRI